MTEMCWLKEKYYFENVKYLYIIEFRLYFYFFQVIKTWLQVDFICEKLAPVLKIEP